MESTGVYWIPLVRNCWPRPAASKCCWSTPGTCRNVPGRKSDVLDCQWLQELHSFGLLRGSFRPEDEICVLRAYWRHRDNLVQARPAPSVQHDAKGAHCR